MSKHQKRIKIVPVGGLGEIGLNCMAFEYDDEIIVVDCGVMFSDLQMLGVDFIVPDMTYLQANKDKIAGYVITHAHEDHIGALPFALRSHPAPIYCSHFAHKMIAAKLEEHGLLRSTKFKVFAPTQTMEFKHFKITAHPVTHSIIEAMALFIETPLGKIIFTGDFKIDNDPYYGDPMDLTPFKKAGDEGVLLLMSDSTNVERDGHSLSEATIYQKFKEIFAEPTGLTVISVFASNIGRVGQVMDLARHYGRKVALLGRSMEQNTRLAQELGYLEHAREVLIKVDEIERYGRSNVIVISTGSQGEFRSALARIAADEHRAIRLDEGDLVIMSSKFIPGNEKAIGRMINSLFMLGADVLYEPFEGIHVSGHANAEELRTMVKAVRPKFFLPVHGEYRHLVRHARLAEDNGVAPENVLIAVNGDVLELEQDRFEIVDHFEENRVFIEGGGGKEGGGPKDISKVVIKDRRKVAETGIVFSVLIRNSVSGKILGGPDLITRGVFEGESGDKILESAKGAVLGIIEDARRSGKNVDLQEEIRVGLRRFFHARIGRKPVVMPILIDV